MSYVTLQAERAVIGAMLADEQPPEAVQHLSGEYFDHTAYGRLFEDLKELRAEHPGLHGDDLLSVAAARTDAPGIDQEHLRVLRRECPNARHLSAYARLVHTSGFRRIVADHAIRIAQAAGSAAPGEARTHTERLAAALQQHARAFATGHTEQRSQAWLIADSRPLPAPAPDSRAGREEALLSDLLRHPEQAEVLARTLPAETFTSEQRREVYETTISLAVSGDQVDAVIVSWELDNQRRLSALMEGHDVEPRAGDPDAVYIHRLADAEPATPRHSALDIAADLIKEDLHATISAGLGGITYQPDLRPAPGPEPIGGLDPGVQAHMTGPVNGHSGPTLKP